ncbi:MAG: glycoside hydrolase family 88 protein [Calditrichaceae bacterium]
MIIVRNLIAILLLGTSLYGQIDWAQITIESTMQRNAVRSWAYPDGFYSFGQYRIYEATGNDSYFQYIKNNIDNHVDQNGIIDTEIRNLDNSQPGLVTLLCYVETGEEKYKLAADSIRQIYNTYPRTSDGGFWHGMDREGQLWLDGVYMILPFLANYGKVFNDTTLYTEVANQIIIYASHLQDNSGLLFHAYDEDGSSSWADPVTHHSPYFWGRSMGWFGMAIVEILEVIPEAHPKRPELIGILSDLIEGLSTVQDEETGLWYQVVDKSDSLGNWLESSCSCMYSYFTARAVEKGYVDSAYLDMASRAYEGILRQKVFIDADSLFNLKDISQGTGVSSDYLYYVNRSKNTNDLHGLGAFLMMCWEIERTGVKFQENRLPDVAFINPTDSSYYVPGSDILLEVHSFDIDGNVVQVEFYEGDNKLYTDTQPPWNFTWNDVPEDDYILTAVAMDDSNATTASSPIHIFVTNDLIIYEAEEGLISSGSVDNNHQGYTGTGFVNLANETGTYLELTLPIPQTGNYEMSFRYANGTPDNRPCEIRLDGTVIYEQFDFLSTTEWTNWTYSGIISLDLTAGSHTLKITGVTSNSAPNIDHLKLVYQNPDNIAYDKTDDSPLQFGLNQNYPNPFNPETSISWQLPASRHVDISIYNILGLKVATLLSEKQDAGKHSVKWDASDFSSGVYFYRIKAGNFVQTKRMLLIK